MCKYLHLRFTKDIDSTDVAACGGATVAYETSPIAPDGTITVGWALAKCCEQDNYRKAVGRIKASGRLKSERYLQILTVPATEEKNIPVILRQLVVAERERYMPGIGRYIASNL